MKNKNWEYMVDSDLKGLSEFDREEVMDSHGSEGWELVAAVKGVFYFKRRVE